MEDGRVLGTALRGVGVLGTALRGVGVIGTALRGVGVIGTALRGVGVLGTALEYARGLAAGMVSVSDVEDIGVSENERGLATAAPPVERELVTGGGSLDLGSSIVVGSASSAVSRSFKLLYESQATVYTTTDKQQQQINNNNR